ncbi:S-adenosylmethionine:tRNA ribosyltransferase-isomerase [Propionispora sp. 2/2-37]|uniref:tRNA preQ1(34) S-adenosylmethionine ribosyltransferase-isomerase QueA n=1 Tax=Propionispora sp. 2/2-37 TaxID=1677858 RepID=UPI0006BB6784|nr:tRNA preQ1(34) S-adenosylmethionine ribosyltransferase-isomerase QueA [Propionispora sp. 2/2-37]CUH94106.1 S-adenosylmethionine:tRNA ribosyltransferase-isomerase [Propionispora sp. 2/2-37]
MLVDEFDYDLPEELIAQHPCEPRDASRLLVLERNGQKINHRHFYDLPEFLQTGDLLVFNDTKVIPARLFGIKAGSGGKVEVFLLNRLTGNTWEVLVKPGKKVRPGTVVVFSDELQCEVLSTTDFGGRIVRFSFQGIFEEILDRLGEMPLPPYIKERLSDQERYQTVYARKRGAAAAPTAGLHFTHSLLEQIKLKGVQIVFVTLHVGLGTFRPVQVHDISEHSMHREYYNISEQAACQISEAKQAGRRVIAVGTTSVRTLETAAAEDGRITSCSGWTNIFIYPGYRFKMVDAMITNFHLPKSTLLMLISAFAGKDAVLKAYRAAVSERYRFFSFGDAMLIL